MPVYKCPDHGCTAVDLLCSHLYERFEVDELDEVHSIGFGVRLCGACLARTRVRDLDFWDPDFDAAWSQLESDVGELGGCCSECAGWSQVRYARRCGRPDPFRVYDRTLGYADREALAALERTLLDRFEVPTSAMEPERRALWVAPGRCREPAKVTVWGVTDERTLDAITAHVRDFFASHERNQGRLIFIEEEIVEEQKLANAVMRRHRFELERVIREHTFPD